MDSYLNINRLPLFWSRTPSPSRSEKGLEEYYKEASDWHQKGHFEAAKTSYSKAIEIAKQNYERDNSRDQEACLILAKSYFGYGRLLEEYAHTVEAEDNYQRAECYIYRANALHPDQEAVRNEAFSILISYAAFLATQGKEEAAKAQQEKANAFHIQTQCNASISNPKHEPSLSRSAHDSEILAQEKSKLVDYLFDQALSALRSLKISPKPSLFLVYAHENQNPEHRRAEASTSKYLINKLSTFQVCMYSDRAPMAQPYSSSPHELKKDGKLKDILTSQLCLLPDQLRDDVAPVDKVVVCCSEVLGSYLTWPAYPNFYEKLQQAYRKDVHERGDMHLRQVVNAFSQQDGFHHVLTEIAFLQIRAEERADQHDIIPVSLTPKSYEDCLSHFIPATTVRVEDIPRLEEQAQSGSDMYLNESRHLVLFKLIERLLVDSDEAKIFLDKFWQGHSNFISQLKRSPSTPSALDFAELLEDIFDDIRTALNSQLVSTVQQAQKLLPPDTSLIVLRDAFYQHYRLSNLSIQRVSGDEVSLDDCYINLAIVESQIQREKDQEVLKKQASAVHRLPSSEHLEATNLNKLITLEKLFESQQLRDGSMDKPKRILIQGRAGIGKTTLCKKLVHAYHQNQLWQNRFDSVVWVPLRQLKTLQIYNLEELLCKHYFVSAGSYKAQVLAQSVLDHQDTTLFILDGLDEVVSELNDKNHPLSRFLNELLNKPQILITSRPAGVHSTQCGVLDLELETVGFSPNDVQVYIQKFVPESNQAAIQEFINRTPLIQDLVNIPIQLDALCYSWDRLPANTEAITMASLYKAMVDKLWRKDGVNLEKQEKGKAVASHAIQYASQAKLEKLMADEIHYLGYLAFKGQEEGKIAFSLEELDQRQAELEEMEGIALPFSFTSDLKKTSYLHTADAHRPEWDRSYHFLHLTFQEFFAAKFLVHHLQTYSKASGRYGLVLSQEQLHTFIAEHKYNSRYEIVWWMVAGLLEDEALEGFFALLEKEGPGLLEEAHLDLIMHCLHEARSRLLKSTIQRLEKKLEERLVLAVRAKDGYKRVRLGSEPTFPEHLLLEFIERHQHEYQNLIFQILLHRRTLSDQALERLNEALHNHDIEIILAYGLGSHAASMKKIREPLFEKLKEGQKSIVGILAPHIANVDEIRTFFFKRQDVDWHIKMVKEELDIQIAEVEETRTTLLKGLKREKDAEVVAAIVKVLAPYMDDFKEIKIALLKQLEEDGDAKIRAAIAKALASSCHVEGIRNALLKRLEEDKDAQFRAVIAKALSLSSARRRKEPRYVEYWEGIRTALLKRLEREEDADVVAAVTDGLAFSYADRVEEIRNALLKRLEEDGDAKIRVAIAKALASSYIDRVKEIKIALLKQLEGDGDAKVRAAIAKALASFYAESIDFIRDAKARLKIAAKAIPFPYGDRVEEIQTALLKRLEREEDAGVVAEVAKVLAPYADRVEGIRNVLLRRLEEDEDARVRAVVIKALVFGMHNVGGIRAVLLQLLEEDKNTAVVAAIAKALVLHIYRFEEMRTMLLKLLGDEEETELKVAIAEILFSYIHRFEAVRIMLLKRLSKDTEAVAAVAKVLAPYAYRFEEIRIALLKLLEDEEGAEDATVKGLALYEREYVEEIGIVLLKRLGKNEYDKDHLAEIRIPLLKQLNNLMQLNKYKDGKVRAALTKASVPYTDRLEDIQTALLKRLDETEDDVGVAALTKALAPYEKYFEEIQTALLKQLDKNEYAKIRVARTKASVPYADCLEDIQTALLKPLDETEADVVVAALTKALAPYEKYFEETRTTFLKWLEREKDGVVVIALAKALAPYGEYVEEIRTALLELLEKKKDAEVRAAVAEAFIPYAHRFEEIRTALLKLLEEDEEEEDEYEDAEEVAAVAKALAPYANCVEENRAALLQRLELDTDVMVRAAVAKALVPYADRFEEVRAVLLKRLAEDKHAEVRAVIAKAWISQWKRV